MRRIWGRILVGVFSTEKFHLAVGGGLCFFLLLTAKDDQKKGREKRTKCKNYNIWKMKNIKKWIKIEKLKKYHQRSSTTSFGVSFVFLSLPLSVSDHLCLCLFVFLLSIRNCIFLKKWQKTQRHEKWKKVQQVKNAISAKETRKAYCSWKKHKMKKKMQ